MANYDSKRALLGNLIDYAGTFPPAALTLEKSLVEAAEHGTALKQPWLYSKMALKLEDLKKLSPKVLGAATADNFQWMFTALGSAVKDEISSAEFAALLEWDSREMLRINSRGFDASSRYWVTHYETRLPKELTAGKTVSAINDFLKPALDRWLNTVGATIQPCFEISLEGKWEMTLSSVCEVLARFAGDLEEGEFHPGIKVRTGGQVIPSSAQLASVLAACAEHGLRFKATQGLHSALPHDKEHGFVNVFGALSLVFGLGMEKFPVTEIQKCLESHSARDFSFGATHFTWASHALDIDGIEAARKRHTGSFGSCSLQEPDDSLAEVFPDAKR